MVMLRRLPRGVLRAYSTASSSSSSTPTGSSSSGGGGGAYRSKLVDEALSHEKAADETRRALLRNSTAIPRRPSRGADNQQRNNKDASGRYDWHNVFTDPPAANAGPGANRRGGAGRASASRMRGTGTPEEVWAMNNETPSMRIHQTPTFETWTSRSVPVSDNGKVEVAWRRLNGLLAENGIRKQVRDGERFESRSDKRVRLDSQRHRRRFAVEVGRKVAEALRMRNKKTIDW